MIDLFLPTTDAGVAAQATILVVVFGVALAVTRRRPDARLLVWGLGLCAAAVMGVRALH